MAEIRHLENRQRDEPLVLFQWPLHGLWMHSLRRSEHRRRTWRFVASWKHWYSRHPLKTGHDCAIYLLHSVNCKFWHNVLYIAPAAFFCYSVTIILTFIIMTSFFSARSNLGKISQTGAECHVDCDDMVEIETRCRIPIWRTLGRIQWHVIPWSQSHLPQCRVLPPGEFNVMMPVLRVTLQGAANLWIHCHDSRATCHIAGYSHLAKSMSWSCHIAGCKNSIRHIEIFENRFSPYFIFFCFNAI